MATDVKKTDHLFVPFNRFGNSLNDSKLNTKIYKSMKSLEQHNQKDNADPPWAAGDSYSHVVEYTPVVRCKDCKHCDPENLHCDHPMGTTFPFPRKPDDFCSYGERKNK